MRSKTLAILIVLLSIAANLQANPSRINLICDSWPPYQIVEHGQVTGFSTEVVRNVLSKMAVEINGLESVPWKRAMVMIKEGDADGLFSINYSKERAIFAHYPQHAIANSPWVIWVRDKDNLGIKSLEDLKGKTIGIVRGYSYTSEFFDFIKTQASSDEVTSDEQNFLKLHAERVDAIVAELGNGLYILNKLGYQNISPLLDAPIKTDGLYIIFNKTNISKTFADAFSTELGKFKSDPLYKKLYDKYFSF